MYYLGHASYIGHGVGRPIFKSYECTFTHQGRLI